MNTQTMEKEGEKMTAVQFQPLGSRILIEFDKVRDVTPGGIIIPDSAKTEPTEATVIAIGSGKRKKNGEIKPITSVKPGDRVRLQQYWPTFIQVEGKDLALVDESEILFLLN